MTSGSAIRVDSQLEIPKHELTVRASRAGGPGGQHVNTSSTRIELVWNVDRSRALTADQRQRLRTKLGNRITSDGSLRVVASAFRSQARNREDAEGRLAALIRRALAVPKSRKKTRPSRASREARLESKRRLSRKKIERRRAELD